MCQKALADSQILAATIGPMYNKMLCFLYKNISETEHYDV